MCTALGKLVVLAVAMLCCTCVSAQSRVTVVEFYNADMDHYFMTPLSNEIALCDAGQPPCAGWVRTGESFETYAAGVANSSGNTADVKICRLYNDSFAGKSTHFYAPQGDGCEETLSMFPDWELETSELFDAHLTVGPGVCGMFYLPVYRVYNNGMGGAPNHRYSTNPAIVNQMVAKGWVREGEDDGAVWCRPS